MFNFEFLILFFSCILSFNSYFIFMYNPPKGGLGLYNDLWLTEVSQASMRKKISYVYSLDQELLNTSPSFCSLIPIYSFKINFSRPKQVYRLLPSKKPSISFPVPSLSKNFTSFIGNSSSMYFSLWFLSLRTYSGKPSVNVFVYTSSGNSFQFSSIIESSRVLHFSPNTIRRAIKEALPYKGYFFSNKNQNFFNKISES